MHVSQTGKAKIVCTVLDILCQTILDGINHVFVAFGF